MGCLSNENEQQPPLYRRFSSANAERNLMSPSAIERGYRPLSIFAILSSRHRVIAARLKRRFIATVRGLKRVAVKTLARFRAASRRVPEMAALVSASIRIASAAREIGRLPRLLVSDDRIPNSNHS